LEAVELGRIRVRQADGLLHRDLLAPGGGHVVKGEGVDGTIFVE
jgi:hypothetical protein